MPGLKPVDLAGRQFGRLAVVSLAGSTGNGAKWLVRCDCGRELVVPAIALTRSLRPRRTCGNHVTETRHRTHGRTKTPEYGVWRAMVARCHKPGSQQFAYYGARDIVVCDRWRSDFSAFLADMGERPGADFTLERKDNNGPYSPDNCVWETRTRQQRNKRDTRMLTYNGVTKSVADWADELGVLSHTLCSRIRYGWPVERILTEPVRPSGRVR